MAKSSARSADALPASTPAAAASIAGIGDAGAVAYLPRNLARVVLDEKIEGSVDRMKTEAGDLLIAVGGDAFLVPDRFAGISEVIRVPHGDCAYVVPRLRKSAAKPTNSIATSAAKTQSPRRKHRRGNALSPACLRRRPSEGWRGRRRRSPIYPGMP
jgi:hypothetical protein